MTKQCKCEHWQQCPVCMPHRFDAQGNLLPPEPTPLQACRAELEKWKEEARRYAQNADYWRARCVSCGGALPATGQDDRTGECVCGEPTALNTVHRTDGPCYVAEPVAWRITDGEGDWEYCTDLPEDWSIQWSARYGRKYEPLYTAPPQRKPLDDLAIADIYAKWDATPGISMADFARAIERAHGIGTEARATLSAPRGSLGEEA